MTAAVPMTHQRLSWGCRRGMLELDILLEPLARNAVTMSQPELELAAELLELDDCELWDLLVADNNPPERFASLIASLQLPKDTPSSNHKQAV